MKKHVYEGIRRWLSLGLCLCLAAGYVPLPALAEGCGHVHGEGCYTVTTDCVHTHGADCWSDMDLQAAGEEADACGHICSEDTGCVTAVLSCGHVHDGDCGYTVAQAVEEPQPEKQEPGEQEPEEQKSEGQKSEGQKSEEQQPQKEEPKEQPKEQPENQNPQQPQVKTVTAWTWVDELEALDLETGELYLAAAQEAPVFYEQIVEALPQAIEATVDGETETLPIAHWESADYPQETGAYSGSYRFTASLPEGYALAEGAAALDVTVEFGGAVMLTENAVGVSLDGTQTRYATFDEAMGAVVTDGLSARSVEVKLFEDTQRTGNYSIRNSMTLDLNGKQLEEKNSRSAILVNFGTLTLKDGGQSSGGNSDVKFQTAGGNILVNSGEWGELTANNGKLTVAGGKVAKASVRDTAQITGGEVNILAVERRDSITLSFGTFERIESSGSVPAADLLAPGYAFRQNQDQKLLRYGELPTLNRSTVLQNVTVVQCQTHVFENGNPNCVYCNTPCTHRYDASTGLCTICGTAHDHSFSGGICQGCGYACPHTTIDESAGACAQCGKTYEAAVIGSKTTTYYATFAEAFSSAASAETLKLLRDVTLTSRAEILHSMTLDLNGHNITQTGDGEPVLYINSDDLTLVLTDSTKDASKQGKITHAAGKPGAGVDVECGTLRMTGGVICGNGALTNERPYAGVMINEGEFYMEGGTIRGNAYPGGVVNFGAVALSGGTITENNSADGYGGVYNNGHITIGGSINITGNLVNGKACDLYLFPPRGNITLEKPTSGFSVGITTANAVGTDGTLIARGSTAKVTKADFSGIFSDAGIECQAVAEEKGEYVLRYYSAHDYTGSTTGQCTRCGAAHDHTGHFLNGVCQICDYVCPHGSVKESGGVYTCNACGEEMCVRLEDSFSGVTHYYSDFNAAVDALPLNALLVITLLKDTVIAQPITLRDRDGEQILWLHLDLNGKKLTGESITVSGNAHLTVEDNTCSLGQIAEGRVEVGIILKDFGDKALFRPCNDIYYEKVVDNVGVLKEKGIGPSYAYAIRNLDGTWVSWDDIPDGARTYGNIRMGESPAAFNESPIEETILYGDSIPASYAATEVFLSRQYGYETAVVSWWLGQEKLAEKQVKSREAYGQGTFDWTKLTAGTHTITCRVTAKKTGESDFVFSKKVKLTVNKAPVGSVTAPTLNTGLTYTGQPQALIAGGSAQGGTLVYSLTEDGTYTSTVPTGTNAGSYEVWYKVQGDANHQDTAAQSLGTVTVARKDVTITGIRVQAAKTYDGTNAATITVPGTVRGNADGENLTILPGRAAFADKNAGTGKTVTFSGFTLGGSAKDNYNLTAQPDNTTADITPLEITARVTPQDKDYDGTDTAAAQVQLQGVLPGDSLTLKSGTVRFAGKEAGKHKLIFTGFTLDGTDKGNYSLTIPETEAKILPTGDYLDLTGTGLENSGSITLEGKAYPIVKENGRYYVDLTGITGTYVTAYSYANAESQDIHTRYPNSMTVHRLDRSNADGKGAKLIRIQELDNLLLYEGCSIRLTGNKGIRMITSIDEQTKKSLISGSLGGFTLEEYGTVVMRGVGEPTLADRSNYAYSRPNRADPIFARAGERIQYTNVLVNFQPADYNTELTLRPYIILKDGEGNTVTLYGGYVTRTIHYIAQQNMDTGTYKQGSAGYQYLENILNGK